MSRETIAVTLMIVASALFVFALIVGTEKVSEKSPPFRVPFRVKNYYINGIGKKLYRVEAGQVAYADSGEVIITLDGAVVIIPESLVEWIRGTE